MKVQDLAKNLRITTKALIKFLSDVEIKVKSGSTKLDTDTVNNIKALYKGETSSDLYKDTRRAIKRVKYREKGAPPHFRSFENFRANPKALKILTPPVFIEDLANLCSGQVKHPKMSLWVVTQRLFHVLHKFT